LFVKIDEIAERVLTLACAPNYKFSTYLKDSQVKESNNVTDGDLSVGEILDTFEVLIKKQRHILTVSGEIEDEGTNALMSDYIREQEKLVWMYSAYSK